MPEFDLAIRDGTARADIGARGVRGPQGGARAGERGLKTRPEDPAWNRSRTRPAPFGRREAWPWPAACVPEAVFELGL